MRPSFSINSLSPCTTRSPRLTWVSELKAPPALAHRPSRDLFSLACHDILLLLFERWSGCEDLNLGPPGSEPGTLNRTELHPDVRQQKTPPSGPLVAELGGVPTGPYARRHTAGAPSELNDAGRPRRIAAGTAMPAASTAFAGALPGSDVRNAVIVSILSSRGSDCMRATSARVGV